MIPLKEPLKEHFKDPMECSPRTLKRTPKGPLEGTLKRPYAAVTSRGATFWRPLSVAVGRPGDAEPGGTLLLTTFRFGVLGFRVLRFRVVEIRV